MENQYNREHNSANFKSKVFEKFIIYLRISNLVPWQIFKHGEDLVIGKDDKRIINL